MRQYENAIAAFEKRLDELDDEVANGKLTAEQYEDQSAVWNQVITENEEEL